MIKALRYTACLVILLIAAAPAQADCFSIVVGKDASADGYVIVAHNEDDSPPVMVNHHKIPRRTYPPGETVELAEGGRLEQVGETWAYLWAEIPDLYFSDSFINEWGLCITSDNCPSREDNPEFSEGGISLMLRRIVAQRAKTAREGVLLAGELVERFGYDASGRTYVICDPNEGWLFAVVHGKHWLAQRVPDDQVAMVANAYSIRQVNLDDDNVLHSEDILDYAISRGWYDPDAAETFDFASIYSNPETLSDPNNYARQWSGYRHVTDDPLKLGPELPFSVMPDRKLDVVAIVQILRDHHEGTPLDSVDSESSSPHQAGISTICSRTTRTSFVAQLRADMPAEIGFVYWACLAPPCGSCYIPFYFGIETFPEGYTLGAEGPNLRAFQKRVKAPFEVNPAEAFWTFSNLYHTIDADYNNLISGVRAEFDRIEWKALHEQEEVEKSVLGIYEVDRPAALRALTNYSARTYRSAVRAMTKIDKEIENKH